VKKKGVPIDKKNPHPAHGKVKSERERERKSGDEEEEGKRELFFSKTIVSNLM
jgi:hypothetical protein